MSSGAGPPTAVLSQELAKALGGRRVRTAVFTTFTFDPGFFESQVLPVLFPDQSVSQVEKVRLLQLEDALRAVDHMAVYYDRSALSQDAEPARLDYRRIDVRRSTGVFHPKLVLLLVDDPSEDPENPDTYPALIIGCLSANLTRAGWWENVECAHFEEVKDKDVDDTRCPFRWDLITLLRRIRSCAADDDDQRAVDVIYTFVRDRVSAETYSQASTGGRWYTRLFGGEDKTALPDWLSSASLDRHEWNLEVISPFFDANDAAALGRLVETLAPRETRVWLPRDTDGTALVPEGVYRDAIEREARWASLPNELTARGRDTGGERLAPRRVHAKVYRLWHRDGRHVVLSGSANCTSAGHSHGQAGNLEASFLTDCSEWKPRQWWLEPLDVPAERFTDVAPTEDEGLDDVPIDVSLRFNWGSNTLEYRLGERKLAELEVLTVAGLSLYSLPKPVADKWTDCGADAAAKVRKQLPSSSFLVVRKDESTWRVLVREEGMAHRPSILSELTPEEILEYWSLLTPEQRAAFLERRAAFDQELEGIKVARREALESRDSLFDRFAGIYHAFGCLRRHVDTALSEGREGEAEARLLGAKYDSLPELLGKTLKQDDADPVVRYVTFLAARQLRNELEGKFPVFFQQRPDSVKRLDTLLNEAHNLRAGLPLDGADRDSFLEWYEEVFLAELAST